MYQEEVPREGEYTHRPREEEEEANDILRIEERRAALLQREVSAAGPRLGSI